MEPGTVAVVTGGAFVAGGADGGFQDLIIYAGTSSQYGNICHYESQASSVLLYPLTDAQTASCKADLISLGSNPCDTDNGGCGALTCTFLGAGQSSCSCTSNCQCTNPNLSVCDRFETRRFVNSLEEILVFDGGRSRRRRGRRCAAAAGSASEHRHENQDLLDHRFNSTRSRYLAMCVGHCNSA